MKMLKKIKSRNPARPKFSKKIRKLRRPELVFGAVSPRKAEAFLQPVKNKPIKPTPVNARRKKPVQFVDYISNVSKFLKMVDRDCQKYGVKLVLSDTEFLTDGGLEYRGCFSEDHKRSGNELCVAVKKDINAWLQILVHEYAHMTQWKEGVPCWKADVNGEGALELLDTWLQGGKVSDKDVDEAIKLSILVELDCERRAVNLIKKYDLPIDVSLYIKKANAYILFYHAVKKYRKWYDPKFSDFPGVAELMPDNLDEMDYLDCHVITKFPGYKKCLKK